MARKTLRETEIEAVKTLSEDEVKAAKELYADEADVLQDLKEEFDEIVKDFKVREKKILLRQAQRHAEFRTGKAKVKLLVREEYDPEDDLVHVVRLDDDVEVSSRPPRSDERTQHALNPKPKKD